MAAVRNVFFLFPFLLTLSFFVLSSLDVFLLSFSCRLFLSVCLCGCFSGLHLRLHSATSALNHWLNFPILPCRHGLIIQMQPSHNAQAPSSLFSFSPPRENISTICSLLFSNVTWS